jgi:hypothetical protein
MADYEKLLTQLKNQSNTDKKLNESVEKKNKLNESPVYNMTPQYDRRQSFYGKARVDDNGDTKTLYSYNTPVCKIVGGKVTLLPKWNLSQTTLRHVKEFLSQNGFKANSLKQIENDYALGESKKLNKNLLKEETSDKIIVHLLPDEQQSSFSSDYWYWMLDDDGLYGYDGKNGIIILSDRGRIYKNYTQFSNDEIKDAIDENSLSELIGKKYTKYTETGYSQGDIFECYYPVGEFSNDYLEELAMCALGMFTIYEVQGDEEYDTIIGNTVPVWDNGVSAKKQIADTLGVSESDIVIRKPVRSYNYVDTEDED